MQMLGKRTIESNKRQIIIFCLETVEFLTCRYRQERFLRNADELEWMEEDKLVSSWMVQQQWKHDHRMTTSFHQQRFKNGQNRINLDVSLNSQIKMFLLEI